MDLQLKGKVALVTGGSKGIGKAIGVSLAREGVDVVISARTETDVEQAAREIEAQTGGRALAVVGDVRKVEDIDRMVGAAHECFGGVDVLVSNAGLLAAQIVAFGGRDADRELAGRVVAFKEDMRRQVLAKQI